MSDERTPGNAARAEFRHAGGGIDGTTTAFVSHVGHECRTRLLQMLATMEAMLAEPDVAQTARLQSVQSDGLRLLGLIAALESACAEGEGAIEIDDAPVDVEQREALNVFVETGAIERARIVVVDDDADLRASVRELLEPDYDVTAAREGDAALELIERTRPDLVICGLTLPRVDGFGVVQAIRERPHLANVRVVLLSTRASEEARVEGLGFGADDYLVKPFTADELRARVATNVQIARLRRRADAAVRSGEREQRIAEAFQNAALPSALPSLPGIAFSSLYEPARQDANVGGDFYDAFVLLDGRVVVAIGDVAGSGLDAAATMSAVRQSIRAVASVNPDPGMLLKAADGVFTDGVRAPFASAFVAVIDPLTFSMQYANGGHPAPILRSPDGRADFLAGEDLLLGVSAEFEHSARAVASVVIEPGSSLTLYTDGITESTRDALDGERRLMEAVEAVASAHPERLPEQAARAIRDRAVGIGARPHDDVALLVVDFQRPLDQCSADVTTWSFDAGDVEAARTAQGELIATLERLQFSSDGLFVADMVFAELIGNVLRHASERVDVVLDATLAAPVLHVLDAGSGFSLNPKLPADSFAERGRGLFIVSSLARDFTVTPRTLERGSHARVVLPGSSNGGWHMRGTARTRSARRSVMRG